MPIPAIEAYSMPVEADLPANHVRWTLDPARAVLLIHDMQRYFVAFLPACRPPAMDLVRNTARIRDAAARAGVPVVYTAQPGGMSRAERGLLHDFWGSGMDADPASRAIVPEVAPRAGDTVLTKWRYSAFVHSNLLNRLRDWGRDQLVICGLYAHVGCLTTAIDAFAYDVQPFLVADAVADFSAAYHQLALQYATERCGAAVSTRQVLGRLAGTGLPAEQDRAGGRTEWAQPGRARTATPPGPVTSPQVPTRSPGSGRSG